MSDKEALTVGKPSMLNTVELAQDNEEMLEQEPEPEKTWSAKLGDKIWAFITCNRALFLFSEENFVRILARKIIEWPPFEWTILATILTTTVVLAMEEHLPNNDKAALAMKLVKYLISYSKLFIKFLKFLFLVIY